MKKDEQLIKLEEISVDFGGVKALTDVSISIDEGELVAIMGPNGAGKSTVLKSIFGLAPLVHGYVQWRGEKIIPIPHEMVKLGVSFVPQGRRVFTNLSVEENLEIGGYFLKSKTVVKERIEELFHLFPMLKEKRQEKSSSLSGGQQQILAIARGLMSDPKLLLLDEPTLGLAPKAVKEVFELIQKINNDRKMAIVIVEHNLKTLLSLSKKVYVLDKGKIIREGSPDGILEGNFLEKVFLGKV